MSMLESNRGDARRHSESGERQERPSAERVLRLDGFAAHDDFQAPQRRPGLAILDYEEGESI